MPDSKEPFSVTLPRDLTAGLVVFLVALPLCLGVALASNAPLFAGIVSGVVGGILVGLLSGSHTSVSGPAAGLTAVVAALVVSLGSFQTFLLAVVLAGCIQIILGLVRAGFIAAFFPTSVIKGLLAAIGVILILKQIPHLVGHDPDPDGEMAFMQPDQENTFSELFQTVGDTHPGAALIGFISIAVLYIWDRSKKLKKSPIPAPLIVVLIGVGLSLLLREVGGWWVIESSHLVQVPVPENFAGIVNFIVMPDFTQLSNSAVYMAALTLAAVASLETLLNLEAVDKLDPKQRTSPPSRELLAQGIGNVASGMLGGLPVTSVVIRSSVNINSGGRTKLSAIIHGILLLVSVVFAAAWLNLIPLSCLAAILIMTGLKLANPALVRRMWSEGWPQFIPFIITVVAIVLTDLLVGVLIGLGVSIVFILRSSVQRSLRVIVEKHLGGDVVHIELPTQVSFLNRAALALALDAVPRGGHVLLDATNTDYVDPDILALIRDFIENTGPTRRVEVSLRGFRGAYQLQDQTQYVDYSTRDLQDAATPANILQILKEGNERFRTGQQLTRDLGRQVRATAHGQHPLAVVLSCIDSRTPAELIFDLGVGDIFSIRIAGNVTSRKILGSLEYGCAIAGAKLILVVGHTRCGAVTAAVDLICSGQTALEATHCQHLDHIVRDVQDSMDPSTCRDVNWPTPEAKNQFVDSVARENVVHVVHSIIERSDALRGLVQQGRIAIVGAMYDVTTGQITLLHEE